MARNFGALLEGNPRRDIDLLEYGLAILYTCLRLSTDIREKFYSEAKWELETRVQGE